MTEPAPRGVTQCDQCGQTDDHPKVHLSAQTYHYDCLPFIAKQGVQASSPLIPQIIAAAEGGTHGADLVTAIQDIAKGSSDE